MITAFLSLLGAPIGYFISKKTKSELAWGYRLFCVATVFFVATAFSHAWKAGLVFAIFTTLHTKSRLITQALLLAFTFVEFGGLTQIVFIYLWWLPAMAAHVKEEGGLKSILVALGIFATSFLVA